MSVQYATQVRTMLFYQKFIGPTIDATRNEQATSPSKQANASSIWIMRDENAIETELQGFKIEMSAKDWMVWANQLINFDNSFFT